jgi:anaerobic C4-dicarboxylate transporter DcuA
VIFFASELEKSGVDYIHLLLISIPSSFIAVMLGAVVTNFLGKELKDDPVYQERLAKGLIKQGSEATEMKALPAGAKRSVIIFAISIVCVVFYATAISPTLGLIKVPIMARDHAIITFMLAAASLITLLCRVNAKNIVNAGTFKSGMSGSICVLGVAWLGTTFVNAHVEQINVLAGSLLEAKPWLLAVVLFFAAMLLYSQAVTTKALMPVALALGVSPGAAIAAFAAVSALFVLPTYPTLLAAVEFDDTGSTQIGKYVFNHPFLIPGTLTIFFAVVLGFIFAGIFL